MKVFIPVRYSECDPMGVVHHTVYFIWYEVGRIALAQEMGVNFHEAGGLLQMPVIECANRYIAPARFGDTVAVETILAAPLRGRLTFTYRIFRQKGRELLSVGTTTHVLTQNGQLIWHIPPLLQEKIDKYLEGKK